MNNKIMLNYIELMNSNFEFEVYRKSYDLNSKEQGFFKYELPTSDHTNYDSYAVSFEPRENCIKFVCNSHDNIYLTKKWLINEIIKKLKSSFDQSEYTLGNYFIPNVSFVVSSHKEGHRLIKIEPYYLEVNNSFGLIVDYKFQPYKGFENSRTEKILSLSIDRYGNKNKNFYADKLKYISWFIQNNINKIFPLATNSMSINIKNKLTEIDNVIKLRMTTENRV